MPYNPTFWHPRGQVRIFFYQTLQIMVVYQYHTNMEFLIIQNKYQYHIHDIILWSIMIWIFSMKSYFVDIVVYALLDHFFSLKMTFLKLWRKKNGAFLMKNLYRNKRMQTTFFAFSIKLFPKQLKVPQSLGSFLVCSNINRKCCFPFWTPWNETLKEMKISSVACNK